MIRETIRVLSRRAPTLVWHCSRCHEQRVFECSELFRANANGKLIDIWLTYRCRHCQNTRNLTVVERTPVSRLPAGLLEAAQSNDGQTARRLARDLTLIQRNSAVVAEGDECQCSTPARPVWGREGELEIIVEFPEPLLVRLDGLMAIALGVSRTKLRKLVDAGIVGVSESGRTTTLRVWNGVTVVVSAQGCIPAPSKSAEQFE
jgi:hypothetical protein